MTIRTAELPGQTTSAAAGAVWGAVKAGRPTGPSGGAAPGSSAVQARRRTRDRRADGCGPGGPPGPAGAVLLDPAADGPAGLRAIQLPGGFTHGWHYTAPLVTMPVYLEYLRARFERAGGTLKVSPVTSLAGLAGVAPVIVNCSGAAACDLVPDPAVVPVRGQVVIAANPGIEEFLINRDPEPPWIVYMFPHGDTILLGGTNEEGNSDKEPKTGVAERILAGCVAVEPRLRGAEILGHRVGLRPGGPRSGWKRSPSAPFFPQAHPRACCGITTATAAPASRCPGVAPPRSRPP